MNLINGWSGGKFMRYICVYAGSSDVEVHYQQAARDLGKELAARGWGLVYGGARIGLMGIVADTVLAEGGEVIGIIPDGFPQEIVHKEITTVYEVKTMHERKAMMSDLADGFVALPGGLGTYDELFEILSWAQLGIHRKPVGVLNASGYFDPLLALLHHTTNNGFMTSLHGQLLLNKENPAELLASFTTYEAPQMPIL
jgi:uncharacterized protein (TIGR00730 family)